jgi:hypothetical protein
MTEIFQKEKKNAMFLRMSIGKGNLQDGTEFDLSLSANNSFLIWQFKDGKGNWDTVTSSFSSLTELAVEFYKKNRDGNDNKPVQSH